MFAMRACRKSTMVGEPLNAKQMTTVSLISQPTPRLLSATIYSFSQRTRIDGSIRLFDTWGRWNNRGIARMVGRR
jgi:hypothetical protein